MKPRIEFNMIKSGRGFLKIGTIGSGNAGQRIKITGFARSATWHMVCVKIPVHAWQRTCPPGLHRRLVWDRCRHFGLKRKLLNTKGLRQTS